MSNNKPQGAIISIEQLEKIRLEAAAKEALGEYTAGRTKKIATKEELEEEFEEIRKLAAGK